MSAFSPPAAGNASTLAPSPLSLTDANTLGLPAQAQVIDITDTAQLAPLMALTAQAPRWILGGGSNVILPDQVPGHVLRVRLMGIRLLAVTATHWLIEAGAGESWHGLVATCVARGWGGLENLAAIPGTVGAAPVQNIGAYGLELADRLAGLEVFDWHTGQLTSWLPADCALAYRDSRFKHDPDRWLITRVRLALPRQWQARLDYPDLLRHPRLAGDTPVTPQAVFDTVCEVRAAKLPDPRLLGNAGSFFKNPIVDAAQAEALRAAHPTLPAWPQADGRCKLAAAWLIEQAGWKGRRLGPVGMHERHALVLVNHGGARQADVLALSAAVQADVLARFGVALAPEPVIVAGTA